MAKTSTAKPSLLPPFFALLIIILFGYLIFTDVESTRTEHTVNPPIEIIDPPKPLPLTVINEPQTTPSSEEIIQQEAKTFVENLSPSTNTPITINEHDDQFVQYDSLITIPDLEQRSTTRSALLADKNLPGNTPITLDYTTSETAQTTLKQLQDITEDQIEPITIITKQGERITKPLADLINQHHIPLNEEITLVTQKEHHLKTTISNLNALNIAPDQAINATITHGSQTLSIDKLIPNNKKQQEGALFYLHRVTDQDKQGLWGIIQTGLIDKFRQGLPIKGISRNKELIKAVIPADADEKLSSGLSSFLGKILQNKVNNSYIYNFYTKKMGRDPNIIHPGQQLILIQFSSNELADIYQFFSNERNKGIETFAVPD